MNHQSPRTFWIENEEGEHIRVVLQNEAGMFLGRVVIDSVPYHAFLATNKQIAAGGEYVVDRDPDYTPKSSPSGLYLLIAPYAE